MANINDNYFDGLYKEIWRSIIPDILTQRETDFMISYFKLQPGMKVLDLMCGYGRHALALARNGIEVTAVDNLASYIQEIRATAERESLPINVVQADILNFVPQGKYDLAIIMGNSLNFYNAEDSLKILNQISGALVAKSSLLINTWSLAETIFSTFKEKNSAIINDVECNTESKYLLDPVRVESSTIFISKDGTIEKKEAIDFIFSINEVEIMISRSGFRLKEIFSIPGKKKFEAGEPRAYIIATKN